MKYKSLSLLLAACSITLLTGCRDGQNEQASTANIVNEAETVVTAPSAQAAASTQKTKSETTDWTFYLDRMKDGCNYPYMNDEIPGKLKGSVESTSKTGDQELEDGEVTYHFNLKNATAFGHPITKIEYLQGYEWSHLKAFFADGRFAELRPSFKLPENIGEMIVKREDSKGYDVESEAYYSLNFDTSDNSITCSSGI